VGEPHVRTQGPLAPATAGAPWSASSAWSARSARPGSGGWRSPTAEGHRRHRRLGRRGAFRHRRSWRSRPRFLTTP